MNKIIVLLSLLATTIIADTPAPEYESFDGSGNNFANPTFGQNNQHFQHPLDLGNLQHYLYEDGISIPRGGFPTATLPPERSIRNTVIYSQGVPDPPGADSSDWAWVIGEYLAFETVHTTGNASEPWNIEIDTDDPYYSQHAGGFIPFNRCIFQSGTGTSISNPRVQTNGATPWIDAQTVYGENVATANFLRLGTGGLLKFQPGPDGELPTFYGNVSALPPGVVPANNALNINSSDLFALGSPRVNQQPQSMCLNILWRREHNRLARVLSANNPTWNDTIVYQEARRRVIAYMQHFYETEYVPMLMGLPNLNAYNGYNITQDPAIDLMFNTVVLRYGHTQVNNVTWRLEEDMVTHSPGGDILLRDVFFNPAIIFTDGCSPIYRGLNAKQHNSPEVNIVEDLKEFVFAKTPGVGIDLLSTNMRRAREMGLPKFGDARQIYGFQPWTSWDNFTEWGVQLTKAYNTSDPSICDPWLCGILENGPPNTLGGELGELFHTIFRRQFERIRDGDRFWYLNGWFNSADMEDIQNTKLSMIILRNSNVQQLKCNIFEVIPSGGGSYLGVPGPYCYSANATIPTTGTGSTTGAHSAASVATISMVLLCLALFLSLLL